MEQAFPKLAAQRARATGDAYTNPLARLGFGTNNQVSEGFYSVDRISLDYMLLLSMYRGSWIVRNVVDTLAEDMLKSFPTLNCNVTADEVSDLERLVSKTGTEDKILEGLKWGRLFGGAIAIICIAGDHDWDVPLRVEDVTPGSYRGLLVLDRWSGVSPSAKLISDLDNPRDYGLPECYQCTTETGNNFTVHHSRVLRFTGRDLPLFERQIQSYWGLSEVEVVYEELKKRDYASWSIASLMSRAQVMVLKEPMLAQAMSGMSLTSDQYADYVARIKMLSDVMSNQGIIALGEGSGLEQNQYSFGGVADVYSSFMLDVAGACAIPVTRLYGRSVTGLGQTGEGDLQIYYDTVEQKRKHELRPQLNKLFPILAMSAWGNVPDDLDYSFASVRTMSEEMRADLSAKNAEAVLALLNSPTPLISPRAAARMLKASPGTLFSSLSDEEVEQLSNEVEPAQSEMTMPRLESGSGAMHEPDTTPEDGLDNLSWNLPKVS